MCLQPTRLHGLGTRNAFRCMSPSLQSALDRGEEAGIVQIDFSAAFNRVNHQRTCLKVFSMDIGGLVMSVLTVSL